jgi:hypothetical protein
VAAGSYVELRGHCVRDGSSEPRLTVRTLSYSAYTHVGQATNICLICAGQRLATGFNLIRNENMKTDRWSPKRLRHKAAYAVQ